MPLLYMPMPKACIKEIMADNCSITFLQITRYRIYIACMTSTSIEELQTPYPSSLVPSPSVSTLATMNMDDCTFGTVEPPSPTLSTHSHTGYKQQKKHRKHH